MTADLIALLDAAAAAPPAAPTPLLVAADRAAEEGFAATEYALRWAAEWGVRPGKRLGRGTSLLWVRADPWLEAGPRAAGVGVLPAAVFDTIHRGRPGGGPIDVPTAKVAWMLLGSALIQLEQLIRAPNRVLT